MNFYRISGGVFIRVKCDIMLLKPKMFRRPKILRLISMDLSVYSQIFGIFNIYFDMRTKAYAFQCEQCSLYSQQNRAFSPLSIVHDGSIYGCCCFSIVFSEVIALNHSSVITRQLLFNSREPLANTDESVSVPFMSFYSNLTLLLASNELPKKQLFFGASFVDNY